MADTYAIECRNWNRDNDEPPVEFTYNVVGWDTARKHLKEQGASGKWDKVTLFGFWPMDNGGFFKGAERVWNKQ
jgi:hypothetical protein